MTRTPGIWSAAAAAALLATTMGVAAFAADEPASTINAMIAIELLMAA